MSHVKAVKQRVCLAIFTVGLSLGAFHKIGCVSEQNQMVHSPVDKVGHVVIIKS